MKKLNNKGMTLIEIIVSVVLISIVLIFLFRLLVDLRNETSNNNYAYNNQVNKAEIVYNVQKDLNKYKFTDVSGTINNNKITITFTWAVLPSEPSTSTLEAYKSGEDYYVKYQSVDGIKNTWKLKDATIDFNKTLDQIIDKKSETNYVYYRVRLFIYNKPYNELNCAETNNEIDDIEISYSKYFG